MPTRLGGFTSKSNKCFNRVGDATASAQARAYALTAQIAHLANVSLNPTQGSSLDSLKSHKERLGRTSQVLSRLRDGSGM